MPTKSTYNEGEYFDFTGLVVTATYSSGNQYDVTGSCTYTMNQPLQVTDSGNVIATYEGMNVTINIVVNAIPVPAPLSTIHLCHYNGNKIDEVTGQNLPNQNYSVYNDGKFGKGASISTSGTSGYFNLPVNRTNGLTIEFWAKMSYTTTAFGGRFWGSSYPLFNTSNNITQTGYQFQYVGQGQMFDSQNVVTIPQAVDSSQWYHYAFVMNGSSFKFFRNGTLMTEAVMGTAPTSFNWYSVEFSGGMDELLICNEAKYTSNFTPNHAPYYLQS